MRRRLHTTWLAIAITIIGFTSVAGATECVSIAPLLRSSKLAGQVFDRDGVPIVGAKVTVTWSSVHVLEIETDEHGYFEVREISAGRGTVLVSALGFESIDVRFHMDPSVRFQLLAVRLGVGMTCDSRACSVLLPSPSHLRNAPVCRSEPPGASSDRKWASTTNRLDRTAAKCRAGNDGACRELARIAAGDKDDRKRVYAARVLTDQRLLANLALSASDDSVRVSAVGGLIDQTIVAKLAERDGSDSVRVAAVRRLTDPALLARFATNDANAFVREAAAASPSLNDQSTLRACATRDPSANVRRAALGDPSLVDQVFLTRVAGTADEPYVRSAAVARLTDQQLLRHLAPS